MKPELSRERLSGRRLMVGTPMYEGMCHAHYTRGLVELALRCRDFDVPLSLTLITNQPCVNRARAYMANGFMRSDATHLMMIDADIGFAADDVLTLLALHNDGEFGVLGGAYSRKTVDWNMAGAAARASEDVSLAAVSGSMAVNFGLEERQMRIDQPQPVAGIAAGFTMMGRAVFDRLAKAHPELSFKPAPSDSATFNLGDTATAFFENMIDETGDYLSEDFAFCRRVRDAGMQVGLCPWIELTHVGNMQFTGSLPEMAKLAAATQQQPETLPQK